MERETNNQEKFSPSKKNKEEKSEKTHTHKKSAVYDGKQRKSILGEEHFNSDYFKVLWMDIGATPAAASLPDPA